MARNFNKTGADEYFEKTAISTFPVTAYPITMACRFKTAGVTTDTANILFSMQDVSASAEYFRLHINDAATVEKFGFIVRNAAGFTVEDGDTTLSTGTWYHGLGVFRSATDRQLYLDGASDSAVFTTSRTFPINLDGISIGMLRDVSPSEALEDSDVAEVALWNVELSAGEIAALGSGVAANIIRPSALVGYWPLFGDTTGEPDLSGSINNLTVASTPTKVDHAPVGRIILPPIPVVENFHFGETFNQRVVHLYDRQSGALLQSTKTDVNGDYEFKQVDGSNNREHYVVVLDKD